MMLPGIFAGNSMQSAQAGNQQIAATMTKCPDCNNDIPSDARFCPLCGHQQLLLVRCVHCGKNLTPKARFCSQCGVDTDRKQQAKICSGCSTENLPGSMFCNQCGEKLG
jgi:rRNA maturation endonuclease Nob1